MTKAETFYYQIILFLKSLYNQFFQSIPKKETYCYRKLLSSNMMDYCNELESKLHQTFNQNVFLKLNLKVASLFGVLESMFEKYAPVVVKTRSINSRPFTNQNIIVARKEKRRAERAFRKNRVSTRQTYI